VTRNAKDITFGLSPRDFKLLIDILSMHSNNLLRVSLFGSRARGDYQSGSDIDLAVLYRDPTKAYLLYDAFNQSTLPYKVDLIDLALEKDTPLNTFIEKEGILLLDANDKMKEEKWMTQALLLEKLTAFEKAVTRLEEALLKELAADNLYLDATIQRFEFVYELCWKLMQATLKYLGIDANSPRNAFQEAIKQGWILEPHASDWFLMIEKRNLTSHTYHEESAIAVYAFVKSKFLDLFKNFQQVIRPLIINKK